MDLDALEKKLNGISNELEDEEESLKEMIIHLAEKDETNQSQDILYDILSEDEKEYHRANEAYKRYISQYSKEYIELSEYYYGPELPYDVYCREFNIKKVVKEGETYLDTPQDVKDLYSLFIFFMFFDMYTRNVHLYE